MKKQKPWPELAADLRQRLDGHSGLLDVYLSGLMRRNRAVSVARLVDLGISAASKLYHMCDQALRKSDPEPFVGDPDYHRIHAYIATHPLPYRGMEARRAVYFCRLFPAYQMNCVDRLLKEVAHNPNNRDLEALAARIGDIVGETFTLEALEKSLSIQTDWEHLLSQSMLDEYFRVLMSLDPIDNEFVYQHLVNEAISVYHADAAPAADGMMDCAPIGMDCRADRHI